ncbi:hypothetical protein AB0D08_25580 [Kitasatospora sp. NPDC048540]|uniref:hypothetical protein n=1 Tax=unclassified Kitasatospora TaxID=2633591 RepID=UPI00053AEBE6|nr:hypothetical protein [Kitasatospora sp. MBT63]
METPQRIIRRKWIFWQLLIGLVGVSGLLLVYTIVQQNLAASDPGAAPVQILDIQSATAAVLATGGGLIARAQYATAIRPMIGFDGRVVQVAPDAAELVWGCQIRNGAQDAATVWDMKYSVRFLGQDPPAVESWLEFAALTEELKRAGLRPDVDYMIKLWTRGAPLAGQERAMIGWFGPHAMSVIDALCVRVQVVDRVGDLHERSNNLLTSARRTPRRATPDW